MVDYALSKNKIKEDTHTTNVKQQQQQQQIWK